MASTRAGEEDLARGKWFRERGAMYTLINWRRVPSVVGGFQRLLVGQGGLTDCAMEKSAHAMSLLRFGLLKCLQHVGSVCVDWR